MDTIFFAAAQISWSLLRPDAFLIVLLALACLGLACGWRRITNISLTLCFGFFLIIGFVPLGDLAIKHLETHYPPRPAVENLEGIIVLGGGEDLIGSEAWGLPLINESGDRFLAAAHLAERFPEASVLFTGGRPTLKQAGQGEITLGKRILQIMGVNSERILVEGRSRNTAENAQYARAMAPETLTGSWALVTSAFHMRRAVATFCAAGWTKIVPWPTDYRAEPFQIKWGLLGHLDTLTIALKEHLGWIAYRWTGRLTPVGGESCLR